MMQFKQKSSEYRIIFKMYRPQPIHTLNNYTSLDNSLLQVSPNCNRTYSNSKISPSTGRQVQRTRVPSQKKLTLTCLTSQLSNRNLMQTGDKFLKKRGGDYQQVKDKFLSTQVSQVRQSQTTISRKNIDFDEIDYIKKMFEQRLKQLQTMYTSSISQYGSQIRMMQLRLVDNARQIQDKNRKIQLLQRSFREYQTNIEKKLHQNSNHIVFNKINDLEAKLRILVFHCQEMKEERQQNIQQLTNKTIAFYGRKLSNIKAKVQQFFNIGLQNVIKLQHKVELIKQKNDKLSECTRTSIGSFGSENRSHLSQSEDQCGISFLDDCFFYPAEHKSQNYELIIEMVKRRQQALPCWIDRDEYLRYTDSNSFIFNRKGDRIKLVKQELQQLINLKFITVI